MRIGWKRREDIRRDPAKTTTEKNPKNFRSWETHSNWNRCIESHDSSSDKSRKTVSQVHIKENEYSKTKLYHYGKENADSDIDD